MSKPGVRTLSLLRHGKSSWTDPLQEDHGRPLNARGRRDVPAMAKAIGRAGLVPDLVLCSDAQRTRETFALLAEGLDEAPEMRLDGRLYLADPATILAVVAKAPDDVRHVMVIGHNPGLHMLALALAEAGDASLISDLGVKFPTTALAVVEVAAERWRDVRLGGGTLRHFLTPRSL